MPADTFDLIVIGAGPAGERGSVTAETLGKRVAIVERVPEVGGALVNTGTLPSKTLRETALALSGFRARKLYGVDLSLRREATVSDFLYHELKVTSAERSRIVARLSRGSVQLFIGEASFVDPHTVRVSFPDGAFREIRAEKILIATGSAPFRPKEFAFEDARVYDSDEILRLESVPKSLVVIGAGVIGSEYACMFAALGTKVTVVDGRNALLPFLDCELSAALALAMERLGIDFVWNDRVSKCSSAEPGDVIITLQSGRELRADAVLVAAGRTSNSSNLKLEAAGVTIGERGLIPVDAVFRTNVPNISAVGDVIGFPALASTSMEQARIAVTHAFSPDCKESVAPILPIGIYTIPEVSSAGETEQGLKEKGIPFIIGKGYYRENARGAIIGDEEGFLKLLFHRETMKLLGVHVIGEQASELVHIGLLALLTGGGAELFNVTCFNCPTLGNLYKDATYHAYALRASG